MGQAKLPVKFWTVPKICPGGTVACLASGPSLTPDDVEAVRGLDAVIVVNTTYQLAPWATGLYAADAAWWNWHKGADFSGLKYSVSPQAAVWGVKVLRNTGPHGLELQPDGLRTGMNSGYQAINLAVHFGAARILLLGYDMQVGQRREKHWHADHPNKVDADYRKFLGAFQTIVAPLHAAGVEVLNCTRRTALTCFPLVPLADALRRSAA